MAQDIVNNNQGISYTNLDCARNIPIISHTRCKRKTVV